MANLKNPATKINWKKERRSYDHPIDTKTIKDYFSLAIQD